MASCINISSLSGKILTKKNLEECGITIVSYSLAALVVKPGYEFLMDLTDINFYFDWQNFILSMSDFYLDKHRYYTTKSILDGRVYKFNTMQLQALILKLKPQILVSPYILPKETLAILGEHDIKVKEMDLYSNTALDVAIEGLFYSNKEIFCVLDEGMATDTRKLDSTCNCYTCKQNYTRAYLSHLFKALPMLCWRYLAMHNIFSLRQI